MNHKPIVYITVLLCADSWVAGQDTKTFPEAQCKFTLPTKDWEWLDPKLATQGPGESVVLAKNAEGIAFQLRVERLREGYQPSPRSYTSFEHGMFESGLVKKISAKNLSFHGIPSYQIEAQLPDGQGSVARILYANRRFYFMQIINALGPIDATFDRESIFQRFEFIKPPEPCSRLRTIQARKPWTCGQFLNRWLYQFPKRIS